jgi:hypothetical protein
MDLIHAHEIAAEASIATAGSPNEATLRHELEGIAGPESAIGSKLIPQFFQSIFNADSLPENRASKTKLLFTEWHRLFGQVVGVQSESLN